jgi:hypothetical protein
VSLLGAFVAAARPKHVGEATAPSEAAEAVKVAA